MKAYSGDLRRRIIEAIQDNEETQPEIAGRFSVGLSFVEKLWVKQVLCPTLQAGDVVVMDNLSAHKVKGVKEAIESCRAKVLYFHHIRRI